jgi:5,10-methenyltetrahydromethanopterin hydrogenase
MSGMTDEEIDITIRWYEKGLEAEDIFERFNEVVPYGSIVDLISCYEDSLMGEAKGAEFYA